MFYFIVFTQNVKNSVKNAIDKLIGIAFNLYIALGSIVIFTILILPNQEHGISTPLFVSHLISFITFIFFSLKNSFSHAVVVCKLNATPWTAAHQAPRPSGRGILQARKQEWVAVCSSRGSSWSRDWTCISCIAGRFFTAEPLGKSWISTGVSNWISATKISSVLIT